MKRIALVFALGLLLIESSYGQFELGLRLGMSTQNVNTEEISLQNTSFNELRISLADASYGYHFGLYTQFKLGAFTFGPEVIFNSNSYDFKLEEFNENGGVSKIVTDRYQYVDVPLLFGVKLGQLRAYAGPEVHYFINSYSNLVQENGFQEQIDKLNYGGIAGLGLNVGRVRLDVRYELNFSDFEDHILFNNEGIDFNTDNSRLIFTLAYKLN